MSGVWQTFNTLSDFIKTGGLEDNVIQLGDWIDLEGGLAVAGYNETGGFTATNTDLGDKGSLLRLIVVGINSFQMREGYSYVPPAESDHNNTPRCSSFRMFRYRFGCI